MVERLVLFDDLNGEDVADQAVTWVHPDGHAYRNDLTDANLKLLVEALEPFRSRGVDLGKARLDLPKRSRRKRSPASPATPDRRTAPEQTQRGEHLEEAEEPGSADRAWYQYRPEDSAEVRAAKREFKRGARQFARQQGIKVAPRGRIPDEVAAAYEEHRQAQGLPVGPAAMGLP